MAEQEAQQGESELIFVGRVESVDDPPALWSGYFPSYQQVHYVLEEAIKGEAESPLAVSHAVVRNSPTAEPGGRPGLATSLFAKGARLVVMGMMTPDGRCVAASEHFGAMPYSVLLVEEVRAADAESRGCRLPLTGPHLTRT